MPSCTLNFKGRLLPIIIQSIPSVGRLPQVARSSYKRTQIQAEFLHILHKYLLMLASFHYNSLPGEQAWLPKECYDIDSEES